MNEIELISIDSQILVDSRIVAEQLGIKHKTLVENIREYQTEIEQAFEKLRFEAAPLESGQKETFLYLTEDQATFVLTLSRNTPQVIKCKIGLVKAFSAQKKLLEDSIDKELREVIKKRQPQLESWDDVREFQTISESQIFTMFCNGRGYPVTLVHDYITTRLTGMTAKELRGVDWCTGKSSIGLNHICSVEQLKLVSRAKYHFTAIRLIKKESWESRADRAIAKALKEKK